MKNLSDPRWIKVKGGLFLALGCLSGAMLLLSERANVKTSLLLIVAIWSFCRFYYFAFYVIEHYVDPNYRFSGLWSFFGYVMRRNEQGRERTGRSGVD